MSEGFEYAEFGATLPGDVGFECTLYEKLNACLFDLREGLYVTVEADGHDFRPSGLFEHFPRSELVGYQLCAWGAVGKGRSLEVVFRFYSPPGSGFAEDGARIVADALEGLEERLGASEWSRSMAAGIDRKRAARKLIRMGLSGSASPPYRPPPGDLPPRKRAPRPKPGTSPGIGEEFNRQFRGYLERWGLAEDYDRMTAKSFRPRPREPQAPEAFAPWTPPPEPEGLKRWREIEERQKAMQAEYERMGGWG